MRSSARCGWPRRGARPGIRGIPYAYVDKLNRVYADTPDASFATRLERAVHACEDAMARDGDSERRPDVVLLDSRAGIHDIAAVAISRLCDLALLFGTDNAQTWSGYGDLFAAWQSSGQAPRIREKLGMVASMVPDSVHYPMESYLERFRAHAHERFEVLYDAVGADEVQDGALHEQSAPHWAVPILFEPGLVGMDAADAPGWQDRRFVTAAYGEFLETTTRRIEAELRGARTRKDPDDGRGSDHRRRVPGAAVDGAGGSPYADTRAPSAHTLFMPDSHRTALYVDTTVVPGGRGVGKTFWYRSLLDEGLRDLASAEYRISRLRRVIVSPGHGLAMRSESYPSPQVLRALLASGDTYDIWYAVLLNALGEPELRALPNWSDKVAWVRVNPEPAQRTIERADREAYDKNLVHLLLFDALEHLHNDREQADRLVGGILRLALQMRFGTRNIRLKVFIRPDMFDSARRHFPDASKLSGYAAELTWTQTDLYGLLFHCLGNEDSETARRFRRITGWDSDAGAPARPAVAAAQRRGLADPAVRADRRPLHGQQLPQGRPYTWLPNHLMDGNGGSVRAASSRRFDGCQEHAHRLPRS
ncbi:hypothetical protein NKH18_21535 [Streptomyces sp. M10(2022)]